MPRSSRLTNIRRQARLLSPYHLTSAGQEGHNDRHDSLTIAPRIRLSNIRSQARQAMRPTNITPAIPIDGVQQNSTAATTPIVNRRRTREALHPTNTTPAIPIDGLQQNSTIASNSIVTGISAGTRVFIPRIPLEPSENINLPFKLIRKQFPVRLCFAMTINKAQGQTIPFAGIYLADHVFSHGQLYVALSRGVSMSSTKIVIREGKLQGKDGTYAKNIVYKEVLLN